MKTSRAVVEIDASGTIRLPHSLRDIWHPAGKLEASVLGETLVLSPIQDAAGRSGSISAASRIAALRDWVAALPCHHREGLSDEAVSRASLYE